MSKQRRSVTLEPEVDEYLSRNEVNASGLVNDLVRRHMNGGIGDDAVLRMRKQQVKSEVEHLEARTQNKLEELEKLEQRLETRTERREKKLDEVRERLEGVPLEPDNPGVEKQAQKVGLSPEELIAELEGGESA